jgi:CHAT domain-containing protein
MQTAVVVAGARSLVSSLWKVPDAEAKAFMQRFYENLLVRGLSRADALREAQQSASVDANGRPRSPYLWAGWTLFGEGW